MIENVCIRRDPVTKSAELHVAGAGSWKLYAGAHPQRIDFSQPVLCGADGGIFALPVSARVRWYFAFEQAGSTCVIAETHLPMAGGYNFRDMGGMEGAGGKRIAWGMFFRSDDLGSLTPEDLTYLASIPLITVIDFRAERETTQTPDRLPVSVKHYHNYAIVPASIDPRSLEELAKKSDSDFLMHEIYVDLVRNEKNIAQYRDFFARVQDDNDLPLMFHCSAGKDRTGMAAAFIQMALGVPRKAIMDDYLASARYIEPKYATLTQAKPHLAAIFSVKPEFLETALGEMENQQGTVENYLMNTLHVDIEKMRSTFLY